MRKILCMITVIALIAGVSGFSLAQGSAAMRGSMAGEGVKSGMMCNEEMIQMCPMRGKMMTAMMCKSLVATKDGGIVVISGDKIMKYDKSLKLLREVRMRIDMEGMEKIMAQKKNKCSMCRKKMQESVVEGEVPSKEL